MGKKVSLLCDDPVPEKYKFLFNDELTAGEKQYDLMICVDCSEPDRMGKYSKEYERTKNTICIDHHKTNTIKATVRLIAADYASCAELIKFGNNLVSVAAHLIVIKSSAVRNNTYINKFSYFFIN